MVLGNQKLSQALAAVRTGFLQAKGPACKIINNNKYLLCTWLCACQWEVQQTASTSKAHIDTIWVQVPALTLMSCLTSLSLSFYSYKMGRMTLREGL